ncbi:MAG: ATP-dependent zinc metalloprotease FtsH [Thermodesulfobacteriota bacterium]
MRNPIQIGLALLLAAVVAIVAYNIYILETTPPERSYTEFLANIEKDEIQSVYFRGASITGVDREAKEFITFSPDVAGLMDKLLAKKIEISGEETSKSMGSFSQAMLPALLILGGWFIFSRAKSNRSSGFGEEKNSQLTAYHGSKVTFSDVAGIAEAREELREVVSFLKKPEKFSALGGHIPNGVLLQGPPGTGKTLLAKAIAGEAAVPFYSMGGSDFIEMFAGVGASRVRELFSEAKKNAPCIIFIDEIDAIGGKRSGGGTSGTNDEREQTLNALLVEMDGFDSGETVIIVAATNRPDILDPALLRPGRFDRQVTISLPDVKGRKKILEVHARKVAIGRGVDLSEIARAIPGFSGAEIANLVNEAALMAARQSKKAIEMSDFEEAKDKIIMGLERKNVVISEENRRVTAYHEAGHAIVAILLPDTDPVHKITIIPRGRALGLTQQMPLEEQYTYSRQYLVNRIKILLGGRIAEEIVFDHQTTGASNDIIGATEIATRLVCEFGMSDQIGPIAYIQEQQGFLGASSSFKPHSEQVAVEIDNEIKRLIDQCYQETEQLLRNNSKFIHKLAEVLLINETIDTEEIDIVHHCYLNEKEMEIEMRKQQRLKQQ